MVSKKQIGYLRDGELLRHLIFFTWDSPGRNHFVSAESIGFADSIRILTASIFLDRRNVAGTGRFSQIITIISLIAVDST
jgi:hypothetical protein